MRHPYASESYARALARLGTPTDVPPWDSFVLVRSTPGGGLDAAGAYPLAVLPTGRPELRAGLDVLRGQGLISVVLVPDPVGGPDPQALSSFFDLCRPFKTHFLVDPGAGPYAPSKHHRDRVRRAGRRCRVERVRLRDHLPAWTELYAGLIGRHGIVGPAAFTGADFDALAEDPRIEAFVAFVGEDLAGMTLWFAHGGVVYNHLTASNDLGYANGASFALYDAALERFRGEGVVNLGGGAGLQDDPADGLAAFKRGFANATVAAQICGAVLDCPRYETMTAGQTTDFFPAYRA